MAYGPQLVQSGCHSYVRIDIYETSIQALADTSDASYGMKMLKHASEGLYGEISSGRLDVAPLLISSATRIGWLFGLSIRDTLLTRIQDLVDDIRPFSAIPIDTDHVAQSAAGILRVIDSYAAAAAIMFDDRHTTSDIAGIERGVLTNLANIDDTDRGELSETQAVMRIHEHMRMNITLRRKYLRHASSLTTRNGQSDEEIPQDAFLRSRLGIPEELAVLHETQSRIRMLPQSLEVSATETINVRDIIEALADGYTESDLELLANQHHVAIALAYLAEDLGLDPMVHEPITHSRLKTKSRHSIREGREILRDAAQHFGSNTKFISALGSAQLSDKELAVVLHELRYYGPGETASDFRSNHGLTMTGYVNTLFEAARKVADTTLKPTDGILPLMSQAANVRRETIQHPKGLVATVQALIAEQERDPERFAKFPLTQRHRALVLYAIESYKQTGTVNAEWLQAKFEMRVGKHIGVTLARTLKKLTSTTRQFNIRSVRQVESGSVMDQVLRVPRDQAKLHIGNDERLWRMYCDLTTQTNGIFEPRKLNPRYAAEVLQALCPKAPDELVTHLAMKHGMTPDEYIDHFRRALDQPATIAQVAEKLGIHSTELYLWARRLGARDEDTYDPARHGLNVRYMAIKLGVPLSCTKATLQALFNAHDLRTVSKKVGVGMNLMKTWKQYLDQTA